MFVFGVQMLQKTSLMVASSRASHPDEELDMVNPLFDITYYWESNAHWRYFYTMQKEV